MYVGVLASTGTLNPANEVLVKYVGLIEVILLGPTALYCWIVLVSDPSTLLSILLSTTTSLNSILNSITEVFTFLALIAYKLPAYIPLNDPEPVFR